MAQKYIYLNDGRRVPYYGDKKNGDKSVPYRYVSSDYKNETYSPAQNSAVKKKGNAVGKTNALAEEIRKRQEAEKAALEEKKRQEKINRINAAKATEMRLLGENYNWAKRDAEKNNLDNLRQLYISYMQGLRQVPQISAVWGAGGEIESLKNKSRLNYESNRAMENRNHASILEDIQKKYNDDLRELERKYLQQLLSI